jgi:DNA-binding transcriptional LysR family regulator
MVVVEDLLQGRLRVLLPQYQLTSFWLAAVYPPTHRRTLKLQLFLESIATSFSGEPTWDKALIEQGLILPGIIE